VLFQVSISELPTMVDLRIDPLQIWSTMCSSPQSGGPGRVFSTSGMPHDPLSSDLAAKHYAVKED
jgi:hypothetical protein